MRWLFAKALASPENDVALSAAVGWAPARDDGSIDPGVCRQAGFDPIFSVAASVGRVAPRDSLHPIAELLDVKGLERHAGQGRVGPSSRAQAEGGHGLIQVRAELGDVDRL